MSKDEYKQKFRPDDVKIDSEVDAALSGLSMDALYEFDKPQASPAEGKGMRKGRVVSVDQPKDEVFVDFGGKSQGVASLSQFDEVPHVGDEMEFHVERYDPHEGLLILARKGAASANVTWENLEIGQIVEGMVTGMNKGGLELSIKNMRAFMPAGQVDLYFQKDISTFIGQKLKVEVTQFEASAKNLIVSRRNILEREKEEAREKMLAEIAEGQVRRGTVRSVMDYGAFVDLGGMDGLLHVSEITWKRGIKPSDIVKVGDVVDVKILKFDRAAGKLSLSLKQTMADPWENVASRYAVGSAVTGRVSKVESFGAFIEVEEGIEGLLPVSEMSYQRIRHPSDVVKEGDTLRLVVLSVDPVAKKMSFSLKQAGPDPWKTVADRYAVDMVVDGTVTRVVDFGAFVELEPGLEGLVHISELADHRVKSAGDVVKQGQAVKVRILEVDSKSRRVSLSLKRANEIAAVAMVLTEPTKSQKKKKQQLRGGLDWNW
ncbi:MAG TPA: S1 RNA-binding domain-containing protein [Tepidisphaeraceae bacterium]|nr:S1 RNA-binding domain-containing protein [Tepidisphaeraceae bacterium]